LNFVASGVDGFYRSTKTNKRDPTEYPRVGDSIDSVDSSLRSSPLRGACGVQIGKADLSRIGPPLATILFNGLCRFQASLKKP
jgi:hypothetical protein